MSPRALLLAVLVALAAEPGSAQNLLVNPGFDRDLSGWTVTTRVGNPSDPPGSEEASVTWASEDAAGSPSSGSVLLHGFAAGWLHSAYLRLEQCVPVAEETQVSFGARMKTIRQVGAARGEVWMTFHPTPECSGASLGSAQVSTLPGSPPPGTDSGGRWLDASSQALVPPGSRSALFELRGDAIGIKYYGEAYVDALVDDAYLSMTPVQTSTWILPTSANTPGVGGSYWTTRLTLTNPGSIDAAVTLQFLGHDVDGRSARRESLVVKAGKLLPIENVLGSLLYPGGDSYGAIRILSSSPALVVQSETSTPFAGTGGTVGESLPAAGPSDLVAAVPKTLAPIRENALFRTNLILANATEAPLVVSMTLYGADGTALGSQNVDLLPLGMTQLNRVVQNLGVAVLSVGRLDLWTETPGGSFAAYASAVDNGTNDPRALFPR